MVAGAGLPTCAKVHTPRLAALPSIALDDACSLRGTVWLVCAVARAVSSARPVQGADSLLAAPLSPAQLALGEPATCPVSIAPPPLGARAPPIAAGTAVHQKGAC